MNCETQESRAVAAHSHRSPSPQPSPAGRGGIIRRFFGYRKSGISRKYLARQGTANRCSLSPGERVRVRAVVLHHFSTTLPVANFLPR